MPTTLRTHKLTEKRYVTVILRLIIDQRERLVQGEVVDVAGKARGRFAGWRELIRVVRDFLINQ